MPLNPPVLPPRAALLLDLDGTLLDLAPTPDAVIVPAELPGLLLRARTRLADALAIVTGRPVDQVDALLGDAPFAVAGEHGAAMRLRPGAPLLRPELPELPAGWLDRARAAVMPFPGALMEPKAHGFVFHFRQAPDAGPALDAAARAILADDARYVLMPAHMAWEVRPRGADKGAAVTALMSRPPFAGRVPVYVGDDVTDEDGIRAAHALGGFGLRVQDSFGTPAAVRAWLGSLAAAP